MTILSQEEIAEIKARAKRLAKGDEFKEWNMTQLGAALKISYKMLGRQWYEKSGEGLDASSSSNPSSNYDFLLRKGDLPPITALLRGGRPENYGRLIQFAGFLRALEVGTNLREKLSEYGKEAKSKITMEKFNSLFFELKIASYFKQKGFRVRFIPEEKKKKTPDLEISSPSGTIFIECKKKRPQTDEERSMAETCQKIEVGILNAMMMTRVNYAFSITLEGRVEEPVIKPIIAASNQIITSEEESATRTVGQGVRVEARRLLPIDAVQSSKDLPRLPDFRQVQHFTWSAEAQDLTVDLMQIHDLDIPVRNYRTVAIFSSHIPSKVTSVLNSVRDAATQFVVPGTRGMVAVEVALGNRTPEQDLQQILAVTPETLAKLPQVCAAFYCLEQTTKAGQTISIKTVFHGYKNPAAKLLLPADFIEAMATTVEESMTSLLG